MRKYCSENILMSNLMEIETVYFSYSKTIDSMCIELYVEIECSRPQDMIL